MPRAERAPWPAAAAGALLVLGLCACGAQPPLPSPAGEAAPPAGLEYAPPAPGTYELPPIAPAVDGDVLDASGTRHRLFDYMGDRHVLLSFVYLHCRDARGCPLATANFHLIRQDIEADPELAQNVRLVTLSFDPERDTPAALREHGLPDGGSATAGGGTWSVLTTESRAAIEPILDGFGQTVVREIDETGKQTGDFSHVLKVFLVDRQHRVRNIYSSSYLHPAIALNDVRTLLLEEKNAAPVRNARQDR
ncbi:MAG: SCO family protein [Acidobacteria bacterium]|nr:SCO family protein [Acidobacteriota bacterium]